MSSAAGSVHLQARPKVASTPAAKSPELAARAEITELHNRCVHEPQQGLPLALAYRDRLAASRLRSDWMPILHGAIETAIAAAEHRLSRTRDAAGRLERVVESLEKNVLLRAPAGWLQEHAMLRGSATRLLAVVLDDQGRHAEALPHHRTAIAIYERLGDRINQGRLWHNLSILYARSMLFDQAVAAMRRSSELLDGAEDPGRFREFASWTQQADVLVEMGDGPAAEQAARRAIEPTLDGKSRVFERGEPHAALGMALLLQHRPDEARVALDEALRRLEKHGHQIGQAKVLSGLAEIVAARDAPTARTLAQRAIALALECGARTDAARYQAWLARSFLRAGEPASALAVAGDAMNNLSAGPGIDVAELELRLVIAEARFASGELAEAFAAYQTYHEKFSAAHDSRKTLQAQILAAEYQVELARRDAAHARLESARLSEALAQIAARLESERAQPRRGAVPEVTAESFRPLGLRPRECEVLLWVVQGKSNDEISVILGVSAETVKSHLKRIYAQLDVTNRTAAAASALSRVGG